MYMFDLENFFLGNSSDEINLFINKIIDCANRDGYRKADDLFVHTVGLRPLPVFNESYYENAYYYNLAILYGYYGQESLAAEMMEKSQCFSAPYDSLAFSEHNRLALDIYERQQAVARDGCPAFVVTSLPKSGSSSLVYNLSLILNAPILRMSIGRFPHYALVRRWTSAAAKGGCVTHDHFMASEHNLTVLNDLSIKHIVVQTRDPRSAAWSLMKMNALQKQKWPKELPLIERLSKITNEYAQWISAWISAYNSGKVKILWVHYPDLSNDIMNVYKNIFNLLYHDNKYIYSRLNEFIRSKAELKMQNIGQKNDFAWRKEITNDESRTLWNIIPGQVREFLSLEE